MVILLTLLITVSTLLPYPRSLHGGIAGNPTYAFIGNSLLFTNDIPGVTAMLSGFDGAERFSSVDFSQPGWPLVWHLERGIIERLHQFDRWRSSYARSPTGYSSWRVASERGAGMSG